MGLHLSVPVDLNLGPPRHAQLYPGTVPVEMYRTASADL